MLNEKDLINNPAKPQVSITRVFKAPIDLEAVVAETHETPFIVGVSSGAALVLQAVGKGLRAFYSNCSAGHSEKKMRAWPIPFPMMLK